MHTVSCGYMDCQNAFIICPTAPLDASHDSDCTIICSGASCVSVTIRNAHGGKIRNFHLECNDFRACYEITVALDLVSIETVEIVAAGDVCVISKFH